MTQIESLPPPRTGRRLAAAAALVAAVLLAGPAGAVTLDEPLTAERAAELALERNYDLLTSEQETRAASGRHLSALSQMLPSFRLGGNYNNTIRTSFVFTSAGVREENEFWTGFARIDQNLIDLNAWGSIRSANRAKTAQRERTLATRADVVLLAYQQFYAVVKAEKLAEVARENLLLTRDQLRRIEALFELGSVARGDVLKQQVASSQAELDEIASRRSVAVERARLANLLGLDPTETVPIDTTLAVPELGADSLAVLEAALAQRPEIAAARASLASAEASLGAAQGLRYPSIDGSLSYSFTTAGFPETFRQVDEEARWSALLAFNIPVFDGFNTKGQIRQAEAQKLQAQYALSDTELDVAVEVQEVLQAVSEAEERIVVARNGLEAAEEDLKLSQEKYNVGSATVLELIDAQVSLARARSDWISAVADAQIATVQLRRVRGERF